MLKSIRIINNLLPFLFITNRGLAYSIDTTEELATADKLINHYNKIKPADDSPEEKFNQQEVEIKSRKLVEQLVHENKSEVDFIGQQYHEAALKKLNELTSDQEKKEQPQSCEVGELINQLYKAQNRGKKYASILSLDGGGFRGLIEAELLNHLRKQTNREPHQIFNLMAGTSIGGILAPSASALKISNSNDDKPALSTVEMIQG